MASQPDKVLFETYAVEAKDNERMRLLYELLKDVRRIATYDEFKRHLEGLADAAFARRKVSGDEDK